jgi:hypothetical protein
MRRTCAPKPDWLGLRARVRGRVRVRIRVRVTRVRGRVYG